MAVYGHLPELFFLGYGIRWVIGKTVYEDEDLIGRCTGISLSPGCSPPPLSGPSGFLNVIPPPVMTSHLALTWMRFSGQGLQDIGPESHWGS